jgi:hypothetical protein
MTQNTAVLRHKWIICNNGFEENRQFCFRKIAKIVSNFRGLVLWYRLCLSMGREIESRQGIGWVLAFKKLFK